MLLGAAVLRLIVVVPLLVASVGGRQPTLPSANQRPESDQYRDANRRLVQKLRFSPGLRHTWCLSNSVVWITDWTCLCLLQQGARLHIGSETNEWVQAREGTFTGLCGLA
eukprot:Filipodium_phascolosomae@DN312_c0_g1_i3.p1